MISAWYNAGMKGYDIPNKVAQNVGVDNRRLYEAIRDKKVRTKTLACGTLIVSLASVREWDATRPKHAST